LGNISKPLAEELIAKGHSITVISSDPEKQSAIEALGAEAAIGTVENAAFLDQTFTGADAVYCMSPPNFTAADQFAYYEKLGTSYADAIEKSGIKRVIYLSSYGAHLPLGTGFIKGSYKTEKILNAVPGINLTHIRPTYFYYNLFAFIKMIKTAGFIAAVYGDEDKLALVSPRDIAAVIAEEIVEVDNPKKVRYVASDDSTCDEIASVLGEAIGMPDLKWKTLSLEQMMQSLLQNGMPENIAFNYTELGLATRSGILREDYEQNKPAFGKVKLEEFAKEFAVVYNKQ